MMSSLTYQLTVEILKVKNVTFYIGGGCKLPGDLGNAPARGRYSSPQNQGGVGKKASWKPNKLYLQVEVEERLYGRQVKPKDLGRWKSIKLTFNDPNTTQARSTFIFLLISKERSSRLGCYN